MEDYKFYNETLIENVFTLDHPEQLECHVSNYAASHSEMFIEIYDFEKHRSQYLQFSMVHYFSGSLKWEGANFKLHPWNDSLALLQGLGLLNDFGQAPLEIQKQIIGQMYKLYTVTALKPNVEIKILAAIGKLEEE